MCDLFYIYNLEVNALQECIFPHLFPLESWSVLLAPLANIIIDGCGNKPALYILLFLSLPISSTVPYIIVLMYDSLSGQKLS